MCLLAFVIPTLLFNYTEHIKRCLGLPTRRAGSRPKMLRVFQLIFNFVGSCTDGLESLLEALDFCHLIRLKPKFCKFITVTEPVSL